MHCHLHKATAHPLSFTFMLNSLSPPSVAHHKTNRTAGQKLLKDPFMLQYAGCSVCLSEECEIPAERRNRMFRSWSTSKVRRGQHAARQNQSQHLVKVPFLSIQVDLDFPFPLLLFRQVQTATDQRQTPTQQASKAWAGGAGGCWWLSYQMKKRRRRRRRFDTNHSGLWTANHVRPHSSVAG